MGKNPGRGVKLKYEVLTNQEILECVKLDTLGVEIAFIWTINSRHDFTRQWLQSFNFEPVKRMFWVKVNKNNNLFKGNGYYIMHSFEAVLVGIKKNSNFDKNLTLFNKQCPQLFYGYTSGQSQKPDNLNRYVEEMFPYSYNLEIFGRRNNFFKSFSLIMY